MNTHDEGPEMAQILLQVDPLAARHKDNLGQLPLHIGTFAILPHPPPPLPPQKGMARAPLQLAQLPPCFMSADVE
jgi:hypothetical protein